MNDVEYVIIINCIFFIFRQKVVSFHKLKLTNNISDKHGFVSCFAVFHYPTPFSPKRIHIICKGYLYAFKCLVFSYHKTFYLIFLFYFIHHEKLIILENA